MTLTGSVLGDLYQLHPTSNIKYSDDGYQPASTVTLGAAGFDDQERMVTALSSSNENELFSKSKIKKLNHMKSKYQIVNNVIL